MHVDPRELYLHADGRWRGSRVPSHADEPSKGVWCNQAHLSRSPGRTHRDDVRHGVRSRCDAVSRLCGSSLLRSCRGTQTSCRHSRGDCRVSGIAPFVSFTLMRSGSHGGRLPLNPRPLIVVLAGCRHGNSSGSICVSCSCTNTTTRCLIKPPQMPTLSTLC